MIGGYVQSRLMGVQGVLYYSRFLMVEITRSKITCKFREIMCKIAEEAAKLAGYSSSGLRFSANHVKRNVPSTT